LIQESPRLVAQRGQLDEVFGDSADRPKVRWPAPVVQREVVDDANPETVLLDRFNREIERVQVVTAVLFEKLWRADRLGGRTFDQLFDVVSGRIGGMRGSIEDPMRRVPVAQLVERHLTDLLAGPFERQTRAEWLAGDGGMRLAPHEGTHDARAQHLLGHYNSFDALFGPNMIWRFTTQPESDLIYIAPGTSHEEVARVVAAHSGGADKSNTNVRTLSFGRNPGALMGVAASMGGDKKVLNIIDKAEYLFGIDIGTLAADGISAHPATARLISFFETEYVLVPTPGDPPRSLSQMATVRLRNPFKGSAIRSMLDGQERGQMPGIEAGMPAVSPDRVPGAVPMDADRVQQILDYARRAKAAAGKQPAVVRDKEWATRELVEKSMARYNQELLA